MDLAVCRSSGESKENVRLDKKMFWTFNTGCVSQVV
jgi:hypothetical protein